MTEPTAPQPESQDDQFQIAQSALSTLHRLRDQAIAISKMLADAGIEAMPILEGVRLLCGEHAHRRRQNACTVTVFVPYHGTAGLEAPAYLSLDDMRAKTAEELASSTTVIEAFRAAKDALQYRERADQETP